MRVKPLVLVVLLVSSVWMAMGQSGWCKSIEDLIGLATRDALPEVRAAAGLALQELLLDSAFSNQELEEMAVKESSEELRQAAGAALRQRLLEAGLSLEELEELATGPTPELRGATIPALVQATVAAVGLSKLTLAELSSLVAEGASHELRLARAEALFFLLRGELVSPQAQAIVEAILRGESVEVNGVEIDGGLQEARAAASEFLAGIYKFYGLLNRLEDPLADLVAVVTDGNLTEEFRAAAGEALETVFLAQRGRANQVLSRLNELLDNLQGAAEEGRTQDTLQELSVFQELLQEERQMLITTAEVAGEFTAAQRLEEVARQLAEVERSLDRGDLVGLSKAIGEINRNLALLGDAVEDAPDVSLDTLEEWAVSAITPELRQAAGAALGKRLVEAGLEVEELTELSIQGASPELRAGAADALAVKLIELDLCENGLIKMIAQYTLASGDHPGTSPELSRALSRVLGERFKDR